MSACWRDGDARSRDAAGRLADIAVAAVLGLGQSRAPTGDPARAHNRTDTLKPIRTKAPGCASAADTRLLLSDVLLPYDAAPAGQLIGKELAKFLG
jgi:hypothetical protein